MDRKDRADWIREVLSKQIVETYPPWKNSRLLGCDIEHIIGKKDNFASTTYSITLRLQSEKDGCEECEVHSLFTKFIVDEQVVRETLQSEKQFHNEILWYSKVIPEFDLLIAEAGITEWNSDIFAKCYYANYDVNDAVVALEDLRPKNFHLGDRYCLDVKHVEKALEAVARSHALAYRWREKDENTFSGIAASFKEATLNEVMDATLKVCNERVMCELEKNPEYSARVHKFRKITAEPLALMSRLLKPENQLATLCHGDFCRNNILFCESLENGNATVDVKLIDFQTVRYASPAIDLSFFFYLSTTPKFRAAEFDRLFKIYHATIIQTLRSLRQKEKPESTENLETIFSLQALKEDFGKHAVYGYFIMSFFLPIMLVDDETRDEMTQLWEANDDRQLEMFSTLGGECVTSQLVDTLKEILDRGYWPLEE
ncbi:uncharacterized protein [Hetaerina americana]|uniref:uncharacterized protein n=1 Tax=Hetaerina americana TaxID=62018 RepID=UPI003A7F4215